jgi:hypothetical protein
MAIAEALKSAPAIRRTCYSAPRKDGIADCRSMDEAPSQPATTTSAMPAAVPTSQSSSCGK